MVNDQILSYYNMLFERNHRRIMKRTNQRRKPIILNPVRYRYHYLDHETYPDRFERRHCFTLLRDLFSNNETKRMWYFMKELSMTNDWRFPLFFVVCTMQIHSHPQTQTLNCVAWHTAPKDFILHDASRPSVLFLFPLSPVTFRKIFNWFLRRIISFAHEFVDTPRFCHCDAILIIMASLMTIHMIPTMGDRQELLKLWHEWWCCCHQNILCRYSQAQAEKNYNIMSVIWSPVSSTVICSAAVLALVVSISILVVSSHNSCKLKLSCWDCCSGFCG